jgi:hypothetical protein
MQDSQQLFLNFRDVMETTPSYPVSHSQKKEEITKGQIRGAGRVEEHSHIFSSQKTAALTKQCALEHGYSE